MFEWSELINEEWMNGWGEFVVGCYSIRLGSSNGKCDVLSVLFHLLNFGRNSLKKKRIKRLWKLSWVRGIRFDVYF